MKCEECLDEKTCGVRLAMKEVRDATARILDHTTLAGLNAQVAHVESGHKRRKRPSARQNSPKR
jgi:DNA-binding IscR family transcriptional regulator